MSTLTISEVSNRIYEAFSPKPVKAQINGKWYFVERVTEGWSWRTEDGDTQEDYGFRPYRTACECQDAAMKFAAEEACPICGGYHEKDAVPFTCETGDGV